MWDELVWLLEYEEGTCCRELNLNGVLWALVNEIFFLLIWETSRAMINTDSV